MLQSPSDRQAADARLAPFNSRAGFMAAGLATVVSIAFISLVVSVSFILTTGAGVSAMSVDFRVFWGAARLAVAGEPLAALDPVRLGASHATYPDAYLPWLYPPGFLLLVTPLGFMSFATAFLVWTAAAYAAITLAVRPFVAEIRPVWVLLAVAPAYLPTMLLGQTSLFWMAGLLAALAALRAERWILAGVLIGCLTLKPQLGLMIPFALLGIGAWRTILAAVVTTIVLMAGPTLIYGLEYWSLLQALFVEHGDRMIYSCQSVRLMISPVNTLCFYGLASQSALPIQWGIMALMMALVLWVWRSDRAGFDVKVAVLLIAILLSAPYLWYYEGALMAAIALFLIRGGVLLTRPGHVVLLFLLWIGSGMQAVNFFYDALHQGWLGAAYIPPLLFICLGLCLLQTRATPQAVVPAK
ncbi:MAG: DUF2029 domain-containing protein [Rhodobacteraceae bacterium]|nr:DUF2029 domain-containing protein [Paracoccaceae bacterium]